MLLVLRFISIGFLMMIFCSDLTFSAESSSSRKSNNFVQTRFDQPFSTGIGNSPAFTEVKKVCNSVANDIDPEIAKMIGIAPANQPQASGDPQQGQQGQGPSK